MRFATAIIEWSRSSTTDSIADEPPHGLPEQSDPAHDAGPRGGSDGDAASSS